SVVGDAASLSAGPVQPVLSPIQDLQVNGMSALSDLTGVTKTPTVSWTAPAVGTPAHYAVHIEKLTNNNGATPTPIIANLYTKDTKLDIPSGVLADGNTYFIRVTAVETQIDVTAHPFRTSLESARADAFSNLISP